ncbi:MAG: hypothetical protein ACPHO8_14570 [Mariniblastus sp.]
MDSVSAPHIVGTSGWLQLASPKFDFNDRASVGAADGGVPENHYDMESGKEVGVFSFK